MAEGRILVQLSGQNRDRGAAWLACGRQSGSEEGGEEYLKVPYDILEIAEVGLSKKILLAHIYSFGAKGCCQSNATLAELFMTSACTISRWLVKLAKFIYVKNSKTCRRTLWAKSHPDVSAQANI